MRPGAIVSVIGHVGFALMTTLVWQARSPIVREIGNVVPIEIVDIAPESNVRALAMDVPEDEVEAGADETTTAEEETAPAPAPEPPPRRQPRREEFDPAAVAGMLDKQKDPGRRRQEGQRAERNQQGVGLGTAERASMEDRVRALTQAHLMRCWRMPVDLPDPERLIVTLEFELNRNGTLNGQPRITQPRSTTFDPAMNTAVQAALRAVRQCDPYPFANDPVVGEHYETWSHLEFTFRPRL